MPRKLPSVPWLRSFGLGRYNRYEQGADVVLFERFRSLQHIPPMSNIDPIDSLTQFLEDAPVDEHGFLDVSVLHKNPVKDAAAREAGRAQGHSGAPTSPSTHGQSTSAEVSAMSPAASAGVPRPPSISAGTSSAPYRFPLPEPYYALARERAVKQSDDGLLRFIRKASELEEGGSLLQYVRVRPVFCALSVELNARKLYPPRIRHARRIKPRAPGAKFTDDEKLISLDKQVIDLHWLHSTGQGRPEERWADLLSAERFDFDRAAAFVVKVGSAENKANALRLHRAVELELAVIQSKGARDMWREIQKVTTNVIKAVEEASRAARPPTAILGILPDAYLALRIAESSPLVAVRVLQRFAGITVTEDKIRRCRDWLRERRLLFAT
jgi:hypothetical protein